MYKLHLTDTQLAELFAWCNNVIMKGSFSGDDLLEAADCMSTLTDLHEAMTHVDTKDEGEEHA